MHMKIVILGAASGIPTVDYDNTSLLLKSNVFSVLIDCSGSPVQKLMKCGVDITNLDAVILTHRHPDHTYGLPSLLQGMGLSNRKKRLVIFAPDDVISMIHSLVRIYDLHDLVEPFGIDYKPVPMTQNYSLYRNKTVEIWSTPAEHGIPALALKFDNKSTGNTIVYSGDTGPSTSLIDFAKNTNILIHECTLHGVEEKNGHSNGKQAGKVAKLANAGRLVLVHLPSFGNEKENMITLAKSEFNEEVSVPMPFAEYEF